ncbi:MAG: hypothetical protein KatS3mg023_1325 [Armatimonadota bacterium]|nr:MAG: hypothetical protein KatS3mg023_1325 [Armatimonadota bacterium]
MALGILCNCCLHRGYLGFCLLQSSGKKRYRNGSFFACSAAHIYLVFKGESVNHLGTQRYRCGIQCETSTFSTPRSLPYTNTRAGSGRASPANRAFRACPQTPTYQGRMHHCCYLSALVPSTASVYHIIYAQPPADSARQAKGESIAPACKEVRGVIQPIQSRRVYRINRVIPAIPIQVRVAGGGVNRISLQPPCRAWVVLPGADMVQTYSPVLHRVCWLRHTRTACHLYSHCPTRFKSPSPGVAGSK